MTDETQDLDALRDRNVKLLQEAKDAKADAAAMRQQLEQLTAERDQAVARYEEVTVSHPAAALLDRIAVPGGAEVLQIMLSRAGYKFAMTPDGVNIVDSEGKVPKIWEKGNGEKGDPRPVKFTDADMVTLLCEEWKPSAEWSQTAKGFANIIRSQNNATGGGAVESNLQGLTPSSPTPTAQPTQQFGLGMKHQNAA